MTEAQVASPSKDPRGGPNAESKKPKSNGQDTAVTQDKGESEDGR